MAWESGMMTPEELEQMRADMAAGTPGPWELDGIAIAGSDPRAGDVCLMGHPAQYPGDTVLMLVNHEANARRIARVPLLEAEVLRLTEANAALAEELARMRQTLTEVATLDVPRPVKDAWREDGEPSKHDLCKHGAYMYEECAYCVADFARAALSHTGMTGSKEMTR
jgi:hypothetical protein